MTSKLKNYGVGRNNLKWFESYLNNSKQFIAYNSKYTSLETITCGVPKGSILGPLLFLIYINNLNQSSNILDPIMLTDDTNLFYSHHQIKILFKTANCELKNISQSFRANKLSLNIVIKYILFHKYSTKEKIPLKLPTLKLGNKVIEKTPSVKFLGVMLDESVSWKYHMKTVKNKLSKNIGLLCRAKQFHSNKEKKIESQILFQTIVKSKLLENTPLKKYIYIYS